MTAFYLFVTKESSIYSRYMMLMIAIMYAILGFVTRILWKKIILAYMADSTKRSLIIVTVNSMVDQVVTNIRNHNYDGFKIAGVVILDADRVGDVLDGDIQVVANKDTVAEYVCREWVDEVFLNIPDGQERPKKLMDQFMEMGVVVHLRLAKSEDFSDHIQFVERFGIYTVLTTSSNSDAGILEACNGYRGWSGRLPDHRNSLSFPCTGDQESVSGTGVLLAGSCGKKW